MPIIVDLPVDLGAGLDLSAIWLNDAADPVDCRAFAQAGDSFSVSTTARVEVRQLANRRRLIRRGSVSGADLAESLSVTLVQCDRAQVAWLRSKTGVLLCVRDTVGTKFYGVYVEAPREVAAAYRDRIDVKLSLDQVTNSEAV